MHDLCPSCLRLNPKGMSRCIGCGATPGEWAMPTRAQPLIDETRPASALWFDDAESPDPSAEPSLGTSVPPSAVPELPPARPPEEVSPPIDFRELPLAPQARAPRGPTDGPAPEPGPWARPPLMPQAPQAPQAPLRATVVERVAAFLDQLPAGTPAPATPPATPPVATPPAPAQALPSSEARSAKKAAKRAAVRRAQQLSEPPPFDPAAGVPEVLVLDTDLRDMDLLCILLRAFGFGVHAVSDPGAAATLVASRGFVAAFICVALDGTDGGAGASLCRRIQDCSRRRGGRETLLLLVAAQLRPIDRVRAELAGCAECLLKPVTRGSVAGALDSHGVAMPSDPRRT